MKISIPPILLFFLCTIGCAFCNAQELGEKEQIVKVITECYIEPLYLEDDLAKIKEGFHEKFAMYVLYKGEFYVTSRAKWIENIKTTRARNLPLKNYDWQFEVIDFEGQTAMVKLRIDEEKKLKYVDYLTLYKFKDGWKVITKQFSMF
ncbi:nuclear transport factor 2 family protein [Ulvibacterium sp.]|uniref:nuclear transport factor 2 family protein n=1 Tax=Ulvibacterium sp. TaxID=2665914 RepID=UPI003BABBB32